MCEKPLSTHFDTIVIGYTNGENIIFIRKLNYFHTNNTNREFTRSGFFFISHLMPLASPINYQHKTVEGGDYGHEFNHHKHLPQVALHCFSPSRFLSILFFNLILANKSQFLFCSFSNMITGQYDINGRLISLAT